MGLKSSRRKGKLTCSQLVLIAFVRLTTYKQQFLQCSVGLQQYWYPFCLVPMLPGQRGLSPNSWPSVLRLPHPVTFMISDPPHLSDTCENYQIVKCLYRFYKINIEVGSLLQLAIGEANQNKQQVKLIY